MDPVHLDANRRMWDERVPLHLPSELYDVEGFLAGASRLRPFEQEELGAVEGRRLAHLQCHFGLDTLSWAREGAIVTGLDFSPAAIEAARTLATTTEIDATFTVGDVLEAATILDGPFDIVYTGTGAICWIDDLARWAREVAALLEPGGTLYLVEFHPLTDIFSDDSLEVTRSCFGSGRPCRDETSGIYADPGRTPGTIYPAPGRIRSVRSSTPSSGPASESTCSTNMTSPSFTDSSDRPGSRATPIASPKATTAFR